jgi:adenylosuccinate lyase
VIPRYQLPEIAGIWSDQNKYRVWSEIEVLYCEGMAEAGIIPKKAAREIRKKADFNINRINKIEQKTRHDVIAFLTDMSSRIGPYGRYLHMGMTSSDLLDTALAFQLKEAGKIIRGKLKRLSTVVKNKALRYKHLPMVGRTHGIHAEPITFGLKLLVWYAEIQRNINRLDRAIEDVAVGKITGAVGTQSHIDHRAERYVMAKLGLKTESVTTQIIQRDRHASFLTTLAVIGASIEKMATEIRALQRTDIAEVQEPFTAGQKGSSAMPHKKNPILTERITGMARLLRGNSTAALENVALWHERDISHSSVERIIIPDSTMIVVYMLEKFRWVMDHLRVNKKAMKRNLEKTGGLIFSQHVLLMLVEKGISREKAYAIVQRSAMDSMNSNKSFRDIISSTKMVTDVCSEKEIEKVFSLDEHLSKIDFLFSRVLSERGRPKK